MSVNVFFIKKQITFFILFCVNTTNYIQNSKVKKYKISAKNLYT